MSLWKSVFADLPHIFYHKLGATWTLICADNVADASGSMAVLIRVSRWHSSLMLAAQSNSPSLISSFHMKAITFVLLQPICVARYVWVLTYNSGLWLKSSPSHAVWSCPTGGPLSARACVACNVSYFAPSWQFWQNIILLEIRCTQLTCASIHRELGI